MNDELIELRSKLDRAVYLLRKANEGMIVMEGVGIDYGMFDDAEKAELNAMLQPPK
jgi:hypothetical protein